MPAQLDQALVEHGDALGVLAHDRRAHAVIQNLGRHAPQRLERRHVAAQHRLQVLVGDEPAPDQPAVPQHHREQPHDPHLVGVGSELGAELREVQQRPSFVGLVGRGRCICGPSCGPTRHGGR